MRHILIPTPRYLQSTMMSINHVNQIQSKATLEPVASRAPDAKYRDNEARGHDLDGVDRLDLITRTLVIQNQELTEQRETSRLLGEALRQQSELLMRLLSQGPGGQPLQVAQDQQPTVTTKPLNSANRFKHLFSIYALRLFKVSRLSEVTLFSPFDDQEEVVLAQMSSQEISNLGLSVYNTWAGVGKQETRMRFSKLMHINDQDRAAFVQAFMGGDTNIIPEAYYCFPGHHYEFKPIFCHLKNVWLIVRGKYITSISLLVIFFNMLAILIFYRWLRCSSS